MEENTMSWKNHSFTLFIFGGIVVLCSIFFVLGMLVGRNQGQRMAVAAAEQEAKKSVAAKLPEDDSNFDYYSKTTEETPYAGLEPPPKPVPSEAPAISAPAATGGSSSSAPPDPPKRAQEPAKAPEAAKGATVKPTGSKTPIAKPAPADKGVYLQVFATQDKKKALAEEKRVESKSFNAGVFTVGQKGTQVHRVLVGPYKESEVRVAKTNLAAKGYKDVIERR
jgi:cell division septation protein DedD